MKNPFSIERVGGTSSYVWYGMRFGTWAKLLASGGFDVTLNCIPRILAVTLTTPINSALHQVSQLAHGNQIRDTEVRPPVFIIGHWRTGTTLLHELLDCDPRLAAPTTFQCMFPESFLMTQRFVGPWLKKLLPSTRPFDNMSFGPDRPQEDEFALLNSGVRTPYRTLAFPRHGPADLDHVDHHDLSPEEREAWRKIYGTLLQRFQFSHGDRRLVLKSPFHAARIPSLLAMYPDARFVFTARDPYEVFVSHTRTLKVLASNQGLHNPIPDDDSWIHGFVLDVFEQLFEAYERDRRLIPAGRLYELRYEDLVDNPLGRMRELYRALELGDFAPAEPGARAYLDARKDYRRNVNRIDFADRDLVTRRSGAYLERFNYDARVA